MNSALSMRCYDREGGGSDLLQHIAKQKAVLYGLPGDAIASEARRDGSEITAIFACMAYPLEIWEL